MKTTMKTTRTRTTSRNNTPDPAPNPCAECPFRSTKARGWRGYIGNYRNAQHLHDVVQVIRLPCHMHEEQVKREVGEVGNDNFGLDPTDPLEIGIINRLRVEAAKHIDDQVRTCTGSLAYMNYDCKAHLDPRVNREQDMIGKHKDAIRSLQELIEHHSVKALPKKEKKHEGRRQPKE